MAMAAMVVMVVMLLMLVMVGMSMGVVLVMRVCHDRILGALVRYAASLSTSTVTWDSALKRPSVAR